MSQFEAGYSYETSQDVAGLAKRITDLANKRKLSELHPRGEIDSRELWEAAASIIGNRRDVQVAIGQIIESLPFATKDPDKLLPPPDWQRILPSVIADSKKDPSVSLRRTDIATILKEITEPGGQYYDSLYTLKALRARIQGTGSLNVVGTEEHLPMMAAMSDLLSAGSATSAIPDEMTMSIERIGAMTKKWLIKWLQNKPVAKSGTFFVKSVPGALARPNAKKLHVVIYPYWKTFLCLMTVVEQEFIKAAEKHSPPIKEQEIERAIGALGNFYGNKVLGGDFALQLIRNFRPNGAETLNRNLAELEKTGFDCGSFRDIERNLREDQQDFN